MSPGPYTLRLLGSVELDARPDVAAELLAQSKVVALLVFLTVPSAGRFVRRDLLIALLWPELDEARARAALRRAVHSIRAALGTDVISGRGEEELAASADHLTSDVALFRRAADDGRLAEALELYQGELMPGFHVSGCAEFERWLEQHRAEARERAAGAAWALAKRHEGDNQLTDAARLARRAIRYDWSDERALRRALLMLERLGDRAGAATLFDEFERRLRTDLDIAPSQETLEVIARMRLS